MLCIARLFLLLTTWMLRCVPRMAMKTVSLTIWMDPRAMKKIESRMSPGWISVSLGGAWVDLNLRDKALRHPAYTHMQHQQRQYYIIIHISSCLWRCCWCNHSEHSRAQWTVRWRRGIYDTLFSNDWFTMYSTVRCSTWTGLFERRICTQQVLVEM